MSAATWKRTRWFWAWQDEKEEAWLEEMSQAGWHLRSVQIPCRYTFATGEPCRTVYRLDFRPADKARWQEYRQIFEDAGWEYVGEGSAWRYWRRPVAAGEAAEIFTDTESKLAKYKRLLAFTGYFLVLLVFMGTILFAKRPWVRSDPMPVISAIYLVGAILYAVIIPLYLVAAAQLVRRIRRLKKQAL